jgi:queuine/archaeosine tRNA-ribosyltransferase
MGVPKETSNKQMEEAKDVVAPLVAAAANIVNDRMLLMDEYLDEDDAPVDPRCLCDLCKSFVVKRVAVILGVCSALNNHDI